TERARGFIQSAQSLAMRVGHQHFSPLHMLKVLLDDSEGLAGGLIGRAGGNSAPHLAPAFYAPEKEDDKAGDSFVTVERLLLGLTLEKDSEAGSSLRKGGVTPQNLTPGSHARPTGDHAD